MYWEALQLFFKPITTSNLHFCYISRCQILVIACRYVPLWVYASACVSAWCVCGEAAYACMHVCIKMHKFNRIKWSHSVVLACYLPGAVQALHVILLTTSIFFLNTFLKRRIEKQPLSSDLLQNRSIKRPPSMIIKSSLFRECWST